MLGGVDKAAADNNITTVTKFEKTDNTNNNIFLSVKKSKKLKVNVLPDNLSDKINWTSSNPKIVSVNSNGVIKAKKTGFATITAEITDNNTLTYRVFSVSRHSGNYVSSKNLKIVNTDKAKYTYNQMKNDLSDLQKKYGDIMSFSSVGKTYDSRNIYEVVIGNPNASRQILIQSTMHAREYINSLLVMKQIESICSNYYVGSYKGKTYCELFENTCLHIIPMVNPDGVSISQFGLKGIKSKKLRSKVKKMCEKYGQGKSSYYKKWKANARGVDLNRNWPINWKKKKCVSHPQSENYKGSKAGSEKETQIITSRVNTIKPDVVISYHSTGSVIYWNFLQKGTLQNDCKSLFKITKNLTGYKDADPGLSGSQSKLSPCFGDWVCAIKKIPTLTIETGKGSCPLKISEYNSIYQKNKFVIPAIAQWTLCHGETKITNISAKKSSFKVKWKKSSEITGYKFNIAVIQSLNQIKKR